MSEGIAFSCSSSSTADQNPVGSCSSSPIFIFAWACLLLLTRSDMHEMVILRRHISFKHTKYLLKSVGAVELAVLLGALGALELNQPPRTVTTERRRPTCGAGEARHGSSSDRRSGKGVEGG